MCILCVCVYIYIYIYKRIYIYIYKRREENQLDATECFIAIKICSTCFGHSYAHHQVLETILVLLPHMMCNALVAGGRLLEVQLWFRGEGNFFSTLILRCTDKHTSNIYIYIYIHTASNYGQSGKQDRPEQLDTLRVHSRPIRENLTGNFNSKFTSYPKIGNRRNWDSDSVVNKR